MSMRRFWVGISNISMTRCLLSSPKSSRSNMRADGFLLGVLLWERLWPIVPIDTEYRPQCLIRPEQCDYSGIEIPAPIKGLPQERKEYMFRFLKKPFRYWDALPFVA